MLKEYLQMSIQNKRKYTKKNCNYWGHDVYFLHIAIDEDTKKTVAYYGVCKRCNKRIFMPTDGKLDSIAFRHLMDITLQDLPKLSL